MLCEFFRDRYDRLDAGERPGLLLRLHLMSCPSCREEFERSEAAIASYRRAFGAEASPSGGSDDLEERIMAAVRLLPPPKRSGGLRNWILVGLVIALSMALIPFGDDFNAIKALFGTSYTLPLMLVLGIVITLYGAVFIGTHMAELEPLVRRYLPAARP